MGSTKRSASLVGAVFGAPACSNDVGLDGKGGVSVNPAKPILFGLALTACFAPEQRFNDFVDDKKQLAADAGADAGDAGEPGNTEPLTAEQVTGTYSYAISTPVDPTKPTVYLTEVEASPARDDSLNVRIRQRPLSFADRTTPVGEFSEWTTTLVEPTGTYVSPPITTVVPAAANSFGLPLTTTIVFAGVFVNPGTPEMPDGNVEFFCGTATGVVEGLNLPLDGSTFAASRISDPTDTSTYPDVVINCSKDPAAPL